MELFVKQFESELKKAINSGSKGESGEPNKDERVEKIMEINKKLLGDLIDLRRAIDKLTQIGPHREFYVSTKDDATLAFRLSVSLLAYYSRLLANLDKSKKGKGEEE